MKLLIIGMLAFAPMTTFARTLYGDSANTDLTTISVLEYSMANCEESLAKANALLKTRNKAIMVKGTCTEAKYEGVRSYFAVITYHKYL